MTEPVTAICAPVAITAPERERIMNKEYWQRKADLCQKIGIEQLMEGDIKNGTRNLKRMVKDKSAADMWAELIAAGAMLAGEGESK